MTELKRYAVQRTYKKNNVLMYELKNVNTGKTTYKKASTVNMWSKRKDFEITTAPTSSNVKSIANTINRKIKSYQKEYTQKELRGFSEYQSLISIVSSFLATNKDDTIIMHKWNLEALRQGLEQGIYTNAIDKALNIKSLPELIKSYGLDKKGEQKIKNRYKKQNLKYIPESGRNIYERLEEIENFKIDYEDKRNTFFDWLYSIANQNEQLEFRLLNYMFSNPKKFASAEVEHEYYLWESYVNSGGGFIV